MTLDTRVYIHDEVAPLAVFEKCRELLKAGPEIEIHTSEGDGWRPGVWSIGNNLNQGLDALLDVEYRPDEPLVTPEQASSHDEDCDDDCDGKYHQPACWVEVSFDTAYGYKKGGEGCGHLHVRLVTALGQWLDEQGLSWSWRNEFTGEVFKGYDGLPGLIGGSEEAERWFRDVVTPAILSSIRNPE